MEQDNLYSFYWDCGRSGVLEGLFIAKQSDIDNLIGKEVYFGEVLGKYSDVYGTIEEKDIKLVSVDSERVEWLKDLLGETVSGFNPLEIYLEQCEDDEDMDEEE